MITLPTRTDLVRYAFEIDLEGTTFAFEFYWSDRAASWFFTLSDVDGNALVSGRRVSLGIPLLARFANPGLPLGDIWAFDTSGQDAEPGINDLGGRVQLVYVESTGTVGDVVST